MICVARKCVCIHGGEGEEKSTIGGLQLSTTIRSFPDYSLSLTPNANPKFGLSVLPSNRRMDLGPAYLGLGPTAYV